MKKKKIDIIVGKFKDTGGNEVNIEKVCSLWNHLWFISQWHDTFRLIKGVRKDSPLNQIKLTISESQARKIIKQMGLEQIASGMFRNASSWRKINS